MQLLNVVLLLGISAAVLSAPTGEDGASQDGGHDFADIAREGAHKMADMAHEGFNKMVELAKSAGSKMSDVAHAVKEELAGEDHGGHEPNEEEGGKAAGGAMVDGGHVKALVGCAAEDGGCGGGHDGPKMRREAKPERKRREVNPVMRAMLERHQQVLRLVSEHEDHHRRLTHSLDNGHDLDGHGDPGSLHNIEGAHHGLEEHHGDHEDVGGLHGERNEYSGHHDHEHDHHDHEHGHHEAAAHGESTGDN